MTQASVNRSKRALICTFVALTSGFLGGGIGWQMSTAVRTSQCQNQSWGFDTICKAVGTPAAVSAATTGLWTGTILGAFIAGLATRRN